MKKERTNKNPHVAAGEKPTPQSHPKKSPTFKLPGFQTALRHTERFELLQPSKNTTPSPLFFGELDVKFETELPKKNRKLSFWWGKFLCPKNLVEIVCLFEGLCHICIKIPPFFVIDSDPLPFLFILFFVIPKSIQTSDLQIDGPNLASASDRWFSWFP